MDMPRCLGRYGLRFEFLERSDNAIEGVAILYLPDVEPSHPFALLHGNQGPWHNPGAIRISAPCTPRNIL